MAGKVKRLSKVARELNVGISTIVDFLGTQGVEIDSNPNTKISPEHFDKLSEQFAADQSLKEAANKTALKREKRETITLASNTKPEAKEQKEVEDDIDVHETIAKVKSEDQKTPETPKVEETPAPAEKEVAKAEEVKEVKKEEEPVKEEVKKEEDKSPQITKEDSKTLGGGDLKVQVLGKIDLGSINTKTRPDKKKKGDKKPAQKKEETPVSNAPKKDTPKPTPVVTPPVAKEEKPKEEVKETKPREEVETIKVERKKLTGPTVVGKIELPVEKKKTSSADNKRKRKRIKKVDVNKQASKNPNDKRKPGTQGAGKPNQKGRGKKKVEKPQVTEKDIQKEIKETLARLSGGGKSKGAKNRRAKRDSIAQKREMEEMAAEMEKGILKLTEFVTVSELASMMDVQSTQVISACMSLGIFASINQRLDAETISIVASEFGFEVEFVSAEVQDAIPTVEDKEEDLKDRPPIITVMGHVDHGKTSLLDYIRNATVVDGEAGGITQHIGAYSVTREDGKKLTFLDTPGHEAFTAMRARGAQVTDVAIIIVAADDDVMPQTKEAISHAQAAGVPMVFAINKIDKPGANPDRIREQLSQMNILVEDWGGKYQAQEISAKKGLNIDELLEKVILEADLLELKANPNKNAVGTVVESSLDKGKGYITNMLVEAGTLRIGDVILAGRHSGRVRAMHNEHGKELKEAGPSTPVSILGINGAPSAGDKFHVMDDEREARSIATKREQLYREQGLRTQKHLTLEEIGRRLALGDFKELNVIVKGDVDGSIEALSDSLLKLSTEEIQVNIVHKAVGAITEADVNLASASDAIIIGFQVRPQASARKLAETEQIDIRLYSVIYKAIDELKQAMEGMLSPDIKEEIIGSAEVRETFKITKVGTIAGCYVLDGVIKRNSNIRIIRDGIVIYTGALGSLKRFKDDVKEVKHNYECGLNIDKYNDIKVGDIVEAYEEVEVARKL
ncbi:bacterial translation initiation factor 2 (bIF-2) [Lishizhenia tianjinensis]|uniref:Translation initiation factor IF-2 n=1 Tax=Lishizhenia tianjinensis TaxID=477690 RepID=A0A1I6ZWB8_9FLAO|nr:translation initiation factor IF-2 [Lishizhenia tianjinensis]SFT66936.1 bacterial translation initiation factor 2 (bIF-2) [Lishizhenia tianjinensis]